MIDYNLRGHMSSAVRGKRSLEWSSGQWSFGFTTRRASDFLKGVERSGLEIVQRCVGGISFSISSELVVGFELCNSDVVIFFGKNRPLACRGLSGFVPLLGMARPKSGRFLHDRQTSRRPFGLS